MTSAFPAAADAITPDRERSPGTVSLRALAALGIALGAAEVLATSGIAPAPHVRLAFAARDPMLAASLVGALVMTVLAVRARRSPWDALIPPGLALLAGFLGDLTAALQPRTWDSALWAIEAPLWRRVFAVLPPGTTAWQIALSLVAPAAALVAVVLTLTGARGGAVSLRVLVATLLTFVAQCAAPATGPWVAARLPDGAVVGLAPLGPAPRAAFPSIVACWVILAWAESAALGRRQRWATRAAALVTIASLLVTGGAYVSSIAAGVGVALIAQVVAGRSDRRTSIGAIAGVALVLAWVAMPRLAGHRAALAVGVLLLAASAWAAWAWLRPSAGSSPNDRVVESPGARASMAVVATMFLISGAAGLIYEVVFAKALALTFGSTARATQTVLATYMGGMALGAWLGGRLAARRRDPLRLYALCELGIGAFGALTPLAVAGVRALYVASAFGADPGSPWLVLEQVVLGALVLLPPTVAMGMTLPILARVAGGAGDSLGRGVALLYGMNTLGAAAGALAAGYLIVPVFGMTRATALAVSGNLIAAFVALRLRKARPDMDAAVSGSSMATAPAGGTSAAWVPLAILGIGGIVSLGLEVVYVHLLAVVVGNSAYAFSLMLSAFLVGLGVGAAVARRWLRGARPVPTAVALAELGVAAAILAGVFLWDRVPDYFGSFADYPLTQGFGGREVVRGFVCVAAMFPPAFFIGLLYPLAVEWVARTQPGRRLEALGEAAALNTVGNIAGVLLAGFVLLPRIGPLASLQVAAATAVALGALAALFTSGRSRAAVVVVSGGVAALAAVQPREFDYSALVSGANVYFRPMYGGRVLEHAESLDGGLTAVIENVGPDGTRLRTLLTNGKFQGNDAPTGEVLAQYAFGLCPMLHAPDRGRALVIGFGTGATARAIHDGGFAGLDVVDLSADITRLGGSYFTAINGGILGRRGVSTHITDGRNFVAIRDARYDLISMEVSSIWFAGASSLYNREFYQRAKARISPRGVLQQWVQLHHLPAVDVLRVIATIRSEFRNLWLYIVGDQGVIVACEWDCRPTMDSLARLQSAPALQDAFALLGPAEAMLKHRVLTPDGVDRLLASTRLPPSVLISTDDNLLLEYSTPRGNASDGATSYRQNLAMLHAFAARSPWEGTAIPEKALDESGTTPATVPAQRPAP